MTTNGDRSFGQWHELYNEVVTTNLCTGCAACIMACPRDVLDYELATYHPFNVDQETAFDDCIHGQRGCDICTKACPRFRVWEVESDEALFGRARRPEETFGIYRDVLLVQANDEAVKTVAQDGGLVSALLIWGLEHGKIEGALVSKVSAERTWDCEPFLATTREEVLASAGSRYTYAANPLAMKQAEERGLKNLALVGMSCQASINGTLSAHNVAKYRKRIGLVVGLLCSKSFTYDGGMVTKIQNEMGIPLTDIAKVNIKGKFIVWRRSTGEQIDIPLKEMYPYTREGCKLCPDFAAQHADISAGGLSQSGWTLTIVRTERGSEWISEMAQAGWITTRPASEDPSAVKLMGKLAAKQRERWPADLPAEHRAPGAVPPPAENTAKASA